MIFNDTVTCTLNHGGHGGRAGRKKAQVFLGSYNLSARMASPLLHIDRDRSTGTFPVDRALSRSIRSRKCCHPANRIHRKLKQDAGGLPYQASRGRFVGRMCTEWSNAIPVNREFPGRPDDTNHLRSVEHVLTANVTKNEALRRWVNKTGFGYFEGQEYC